MRLLYTLFILCGTSITLIYAHPTSPQYDVYGSDPDEIIYTEGIVPNQDEPYPFFTAPSEPEPEDKILYDLRAMLTGFVLCQTSDASPDADEAIQAIQGLRARLYVPAQQNRIDPPLCTDLKEYGHAVVAICGPHGTWMQSKDAGKMANHIYRHCRALHGDKIRIGGQYVFNNDTEPKSLMQVYHIRDALSKTGPDH